MFFFLKKSRSAEKSLGTAGQYSYTYLKFVASLFIVIYGCELSVNLKVLYTINIVNDPQLSIAKLSN